MTSIARNGISFFFLLGAARSLAGRLPPGPQGNFGAFEGAVVGAFGPDFQDSFSRERRQIKGGGLKVNDETVTDEKMTLGTGNLTPQSVIKLSLGRKKHVLLRPA